MRQRHLATSDTPAFVLAKFGYRQWNPKHSVVIGSIFLSIFIAFAIFIPHTLKMDYWSIINLYSDLQKPKKKNYYWRTLPTKAKNIIARVYRNMRGICSQTRGNNLFMRKNPTSRCFTGKNPFGKQRLRAFVSNSLQSRSLPFWLSFVPVNVDALLGIIGKWFTSQQHFKNWFDLVLAAKPT